MLKILIVFLIVLSYPCREISAVGICSDCKQVLDKTEISENKILDGDLKINKVKKYTYKVTQENILLQLCYLDSACSVREALMSYDSIRRKSIAIAAFVPWTYIDKKYCHSVVHFVSRKGVDSSSNQAKAPHRGIGPIDYDFESPVYMRALKAEVNKLDLWKVELVDEQDT